MTSREQRTQQRDRKMSLEKGNEKMQSEQKKIFPSQLCFFRAPTCTSMFS